MKMSQFWIRVLGVFGILGGLILLAGDMLLYYDPVNMSLKQNMGNASDFRIIASGVCALFAAWFYMLGLGQVYYAFKTTKPIFRNGTLISFGSILISYGIVHGAFLAIATTAKLATEHSLDINEAVLLSEKTNEILRLFVYPLFGILSILFISQVWKRKTLYPRWIILFFPLIPFLIEDLVTKYLQNDIWIIIKGGYLNIILVIFFTASTIALWNIKKSEIISE
ncbi:DUF6796 family protein [Polaribacter sp. Hel1_33_78]|jgi:hypothetical protein|uniref:DUF6796 family protein n=1 Tax=Polaribacter sp. Hel1_33_78 TaxID=1336804 RepID=UPI000B80AABC|nr:DUF6796 family protein [Polaribacter sp. Hel1_33_78]MDG2435567.1 hypothetical protein [Polaribacter sp.]